MPDLYVEGAESSCGTDSTTTTELTTMNKDSDVVDYAIVKEARSPKRGFLRRFRKATIVDAHQQEQPHQITSVGLRDDDSSWHPPNDNYNNANVVKIRKWKKIKGTTHDASPNFKNKNQLYFYNIRHFAKLRGSRYKVLRAEGIKCFKVAIPTLKMVLVSKIHH